MRQQLQERLNILRNEFDSGQKMLAELDARQNQLQATLLRIGGAIQVLEELLDSEAQAGHEPAFVASDEP